MSENLRSTGGTPGRRLWTMWIVEPVDPGDPNEELNQDRDRGKGSEMSTLLSPGGI